MRTKRDPDVLPGITRIRLQAWREDMDRPAADWPDAMFRERLWYAYLDKVLNALGIPPAPHRCSICGKAHAPEPTP